MSKKKPKVKKYKVPSEEDVKRLYKAQDALQKTIGENKEGDGELLSPIVFSQLRALLVNDGTRTMKPLLQRVMRENSISLLIFTIPTGERNDCLVSLQQGKEWMANKTEGASLDLTLDDYLSQKIIFNPYENKYIDRNELIRIFADADGSHYDPELTKFFKWMEQSKVKLNGRVLSQKELFMWDMYMLFDYSTNYIAQILGFREARAKSPSLKDVHYSELEQALDNIRNIFDEKMKAPISRISFYGVRTCPECEGNLSQEITDNRYLNCDDCEYRHKLEISVD